MNQNEFFLRILITIVLGAILGLETETRAIELEGKKIAQKESRQKIGGLRTYTVLSLFGGIAGIFYGSGANVIVYILFFTIIAFTLAAYVMNIRLKKAFGMTTEIAIIITFALGFMTTFNIVPLEIVFLIIVLLTFFMSQKRGIGAAIEKIRHREVIDIIKFGLISIAILPLLPNHDFLLSEVLHIIDPKVSLTQPIANIVLVNPFLTWLLVVLVSGINLLGYVLSKFMGKNKGLFIVGLIGGLVSSTSATISLAIKSKDDSSSSRLFAGVSIISTAVSFITISALLFVSSKVLFRELFPVIMILMISGALIGIYLIQNVNKDKKNKHGVSLKYQPFSIGPALKFVGMILLIKLSIQFLMILNVSGPLFLLISSLSGLTGMDAVVIAFGDLVNNSTISLSSGILAFMIANYINFFGKSMYSLFLGNRKYFLYLTAGLLLTGLLGIIGIFI